MPKTEEDKEIKEILDQIEELQTKAVDILMRSINPYRGIINDSVVYSVNHLIERVVRPLKEERDLLMKIVEQHGLTREFENILQGLNARINYFRVEKSNEVPDKNFSEEYSKLFKPKSIQETKCLSSVPLKEQK
jgi:hypothetical protein